MDLMFTVSQRDALPILLPLLRASKRRGTQCACFFTDSGVEVLDSDELCELLTYATQAVACEFSWERYRKGMPCPIESGSQTNNSAMTAAAKHLVSL